MSRLVMVSNRVVDLDNQRQSGALAVALGEALRAIGRRLRRTYAYILAIQALAYLGKIIIHPTPVTSFGELVQRAAIGPIPGEAILAAGVVFNGAWIMFAFVTYYTDPDVVDADLADYFNAGSV